MPSFQDGIPLSDGWPLSPTHLASFSSSPALWPIVEEVLISQGFDELGRPVTANAVSIKRETRVEHVEVVIDSKYI